jgi:hypothetical protein
MKKSTWIYLLLIVVISTLILKSCKKKDVPVLTTLEISNITKTSATSGGNITYEGSSPVIVKGLCWSSSSMPSVDNNKTNDGTGGGSFNSILKGLNTGTTYFVRAYATNSEGTGYGSEISFSTLRLTEKETLLTSHGWKCSSIKVNGNEASLMLCQTDDYWVFKPDGTYVLYMGTHKCSSYDFDHTGTWFLSNDEKTITYADTGLPGTTTSINIAVNEMILTLIENGDTLVYTYIPI